MIHGIGVDMCTISRVEKLQLKYQNRFTQRLLTEREQEGRTITPAFLAKRFAAKEAVIKAVGTAFKDGLFLKDVEILSNEAGKPYVELSAALTAKLPEGVTVHVSICDEENTAIAYAVAEVRP